MKLQINDEEIYRAYNVNIVPVIEPWQDKFSQTWLKTNVSLAPI